VGRRRDTGKGQVRLNAELDAYISRAGVSGFKDSVELKTAWEKVCGQDALDHTDNVIYSKRTHKKTQKTVIVVYMDDSHWAAELSMNKELLRLKLAQTLHRPIEDIVFEVNRRAAIKRVFRKQGENKTGQAERVAPQKLTSEESGHARKMLVNIEDEKLKESLYRAIKTDLEWKKGIEALKSSQKAPESPKTT
jgi:hypothetical protein